MAYDYIWIFPLVFLVLLSLLLWLIIGSRGPWALKLFMIFMSAGACFAEWQGIAGLLGHAKRYSSTYELYGKKAELYAYVVKEDKVIYLFLKMNGQIDPELISIPYTKQDAKAAQGFNLSGEDPAHIEFSNADPSAGGNQGGSKTKGQRSKLLYVLPPEVPPTK